MRKIDPIKHEEKRRQILQAASLCFVRCGFRGASISDICAEAKMSPGHLYHYFENKEAIVAAITELGIEFATTRIRAITEECPDITLSALIGRLADEKFRSADPENSQSRRLTLEILAESCRNPAVADTVQKHSRTLRTILSDFLRKSQARGHVDSNLDPDEAAMLVIGILDGSRLLPIRHPAITIDRMIGMAKQVIDRYLSPTR